MVTFKTLHRLQSLGAERSRFLASSLPCHRVCNSAFVSLVAHQPLGPCLRQIGGAIFAAIDRKVSVSTTAMSSTLRVVVPGGKEASFAVVSLLRSSRRPGSAIKGCRSIARRPLLILFGRFRAKRPQRCIFPKTKWWSDSCCSSGWEDTVVLQIKSYVGTPDPSCAGRSICVYQDKEGIPTGTSVITLSSTYQK